MYGGMSAKQRRKTDALRLRAEESRIREMMSNTSRLSSSHLYSSTNSARHSHPHQASSGGGGGSHHVASVGQKRTSEVIDLISSDEEEAHVPAPVANRRSFVDASFVSIGSAVGVANINSASGGGRNSIAGSSSNNSTIVDLVDSDEDSGDIFSAFMGGELSDDDGFLDTVLSGLDESDSGVVDSSSSLSSLRRLSTNSSTGGVALSVTAPYTTITNPPSFPLTSVIPGRIPDSGGSQMNNTRNTPMSMAPPRVSLGNTSIARNAAAQAQTIHPPQVTSQQSAKKAKVDGAQSSVSKSAASIKTEFPPKGFGEADIEGELAEISMSMEATPLKSSLDRSNSNTSSNSNSNSKSINKSSVKALDSDDDDIEVIGDNMMAISDMPHSRESCQTYKFSSQSATINSQYCHNCYCYVCEIKASECQSWKIHCFANLKEPKWKVMRKTSKNPLMRLLSGNTVTELLTVIKDARDPLNSSYYDRENHNSSICNQEMPSIKAVLSALDARPFSSLKYLGDKRLIADYREKVIRGLYIICQFGLTSMHNPNVAELNRGFLQRLLLHSLGMQDIVNAVLNLPPFDYVTNVNQKFTFTIKSAVDRLKFNFDVLSKYFKGDIVAPPFWAQFDTLNIEDMSSFIKVGICHWIAQKDPWKLVDFLWCFSTAAVAVNCLMNIITGMYQPKPPEILGGKFVDSAPPNYDDFGELGTLLQFISKMRYLKVNARFNSKDFQHILPSSFTNQYPRYLSVCSFEDFWLIISKLPNHLIIMIISVFVDVFAYNATTNLQLLKVEYKPPQPLLRLFRVFLNEAFCKMFGERDTRESVGSSVEARRKAQLHSFWYPRSDLKSFSAGTLSWLLPALDRCNDQNRYFKSRFVFTAFDSATLKGICQIMTEQDWLSLFIGYVVNAPWFTGNTAFSMSDIVLSVSDSASIQYEVIGVSDASTPLQSEYSDFFKFLPDMNTKTYMVLSTIYGKYSGSKMANLYLFLGALYSSKVGVDESKQDLGKNLLPRVEGAFEFFPTSCKVALSEYFRKRACVSLTHTDRSDRQYPEFYSDDDLVSIYMIVKEWTEFNTLKNKEEGRANPLDLLSGLDQLLFLTFSMVLVQRAREKLSTDSLMFLIDKIATPISKSFVSSNSASYVFQFSFGLLGSDSWLTSLGFSQEFLTGAPLMLLFHHCLNTLVKSDRYNDKIAYVMPTLASLHSSTHFENQSLYLSKDSTMNEFIATLDKIDSKIRASSIAHRRPDCQTTGALAFKFVFVHKCGYHPKPNYVDPDWALDGTDCLAILLSMTSELLAANFTSAYSVIAPMLAILDSNLCDWRNKMSLQSFPDSFLWSLPPKETEKIMMKTLDSDLIHNYINSIIVGTDHKTASDKYMALLILINSIRKTAITMSSSLPDPFTVASSRSPLCSNSIILSYDFTTLLKMNNYDALTEMSPLYFNFEHFKHKTQFDESCFIKAVHDQHNLKYFFANYSELQHAGSRVYAFDPFVRDFLSEHVHYIKGVVQKGSSGCAKWLESESQLNTQTASSNGGYSPQKLEAILNTMSSMGDLMLVSHLVYFAIQISSAAISFMKSVIWNGSFDHHYFKIETWGHIRESFSFIIESFKRIIDEYFDVIGKIECDESLLTISIQKIMLSAVIDSFDFRRYPVGFIIHHMLYGREIGAAMNDVKTPIMRLLSEVQYQVFYLESLVLQIDFLAHATSSKFSHFAGLILDLDKNVHYVNGTREESLLHISPLDLRSDITTKLDAKGQLQNLASFIWNTSLIKTEDSVLDMSKAVGHPIAHDQVYSYNSWGDKIRLPIMLQHFPIDMIEQFLHIFVNNRRVDKPAHRDIWQSVKINSIESPSPHFMLKLVVIFNQDPKLSSISAAESNPSQMSESLDREAEAFTYPQLNEYCGDFESMFGLCPEELVATHNLNVTRVVFIKKILLACLTVTDSARLMQLLKLVLSFIPDYVDAEYVYFLRPNITRAISHFRNSFSGGPLLISSCRIENSLLYYSTIDTINFEFEQPSAMAIDQGDRKGKLGSVFFDLQPSLVQFEDTGYKRGVQKFTHGNSYGVGNVEVVGAMDMSDSSSSSSSSSSISISTSTSAKGYKYRCDAHDYRDFIDASDFLKLLTFIENPSIDTLSSARQEDWLYHFRSFHEKLYMFCCQPTLYNVMVEMLSYYQDFRPLYSIFSRFQRSRFIIKEIMTSLNLMFKPERALIFNTYEEKVFNGKFVPFAFAFSAKGILTNIGSWVLFHAETSKVKNVSGQRVDTDSDVVLQFMNTIVAFLRGLDENVMRAATAFLQFTTDITSVSLLQFMKEYITAKDLVQSAGLVVPKENSHIKTYIHSVIFDDCRMAKIGCISTNKYLQLMYFAELLGYDATGNVPQDSMVLVDKVMTFLVGSSLVVSEGASAAQKEVVKFHDSRSILGLSRIFSTIGYMPSNHGSSLTEFGPSIISRLFSMFIDEIFEQISPAVVSNIPGAVRENPIALDFRLKVKYNKNYEPFKTIVMRFVKGSDVKSRCLYSIVNVWITFSESETVSPTDVLDIKQLRASIEHGFKSLEGIQKLQNSSSAMDIDSTHLPLKAAFREYALVLTRLFIRHFNEGLTKNARRVLDTCTGAFDCITYLAGLLPAQSRHADASEYLSEFQSFIVQVVKMDAGRSGVLCNVFDHIINVYLKKPNNYSSSATTESSSELKKSIFASLEIMALGIFPYSDFNIFTFYTSKFDANFRTSLLMLYRKFENQAPVLEMFKSKFKEIVEACEVNRIDARSKESITEAVKAFKHYFVLVNQSEWVTLNDKMIKTAKKKTIKDLLISYK